MRANTSSARKARRSSRTIAMGALKESYMRRSRRVRHALKRAANERARLSVFRSSRHIYAQVIDDKAGKTVAAASTLDKAIIPPAASAGLITRPLLSMLGAVKCN